MSAIKVYNTKSGILIDVAGTFHIDKSSNWDSFINRDHLYSILEAEAKNLPIAPNASTLIANELLAPLGTQEVWAAGVTYFRSKVARAEESKESGGSFFYNKVYDADRPELFFKSTAKRVAAPYEGVNIRKDSTWNVPEPEVTLVITSSGKIIGYTIGNDMSSRSIEGENPLYLPQAKVYEKACSIGPCVYITNEPLSPETEIKLEIDRAGSNVFTGTTAVNQIKRKFEELVEFLYRECAFETGAYLLTGTGIVPENEFTLQKGDKISITIGNIGTLVNTVN